MHPVTIKTVTLMFFRVSSDSNDHFFAITKALTASRGQNWRAESWLQTSEKESFPHTPFTATTFVFCLQLPKDPTKLPRFTSVPPVPTHQHLGQSRSVGTGVHQMRGKFVQHVLPTIA